MKKIILLTIGIMLSLSGLAESKTVVFTVEPPLVCGNCEKKVKENLRFEKGVKSVKPSAKKAEVEVVYDDTKTDIDHLKEGFSKIGYKAAIKEDNSEALSCGSCVKEQPCESTSCCGGE